MGRANPLLLPPHPAPKSGKPGSPYPGPFLECLQGASTFYRSYLLNPLGNPEMGWPYNIHKEIASS